MKQLLTSSVGLKIVMAITGFALFGFIVMHMLGNLQIFVGPDAINDYAIFLESLGPGLWVARIVILCMLVSHVIVAYRLTVINQTARPVRYVMKTNVQASLISGYMGIIGSFIMCFVIFHLVHFTFHVVDPSFAHLKDASGRHDVYAMVITGFKDPLMATAYIVAMIILGAHMWHGIPSFFQTLGIRHAVFTKFIEIAGPVVSIVIATGFCSIPVAVLAGIL